MTTDNSIHAWEKSCKGGSRISFKTAKGVSRRWLLDTVADNDNEISQPLLILYMLLLLLQMIYVRNIKFFIFLLDVFDGDVKLWWRTIPSAMNVVYGIMPKR